MGDLEWRSGDRVFGGDFEFTLPADGVGGSVAIADKNGEDEADADADAFDESLEDIGDDFEVLRLSWEHGTDDEAQSHKEDDCPAMPMMEALDRLEQEASKAFHSLGGILEEAAAADRKA